MNRIRIGFVVTFIVLSLIVVGCENLLEYSPFTNDVKDEWRKQNETSLDKISSGINQEFTPFKVGLIADSHTYYDEFEDQVDYLNSREDLDFIIHLGDITLGSYMREFNWYSEIMNRIDQPVFTIIGNHDCLGNGHEIYKEMFGTPNMQFSYKGVKFVLFDDVIWEKQIEDPDLLWLYDALENDNNYKYVLPFAHIPPWDSQFSIGNRYLYHEIMKDRNIQFSVHGHDHSYKLNQTFGDGNVNYLVVPSCEKYEMVVMNFQKDTILIDRVQY